MIAQPGMNMLRDMRILTIGVLLDLPVKQNVIQFMVEQHGGMKNMKNAYVMTMGFNLSKKKA